MKWYILYVLCYNIIIIIIQFNERTFYNLVLSLMGKTKYYNIVL